MKKIAVVTSAVLMVMGAAIAGADEGQPAGGEAAAQTVKRQTLCPIMGGQVNTNLYVDAKGARVYFCCKGCPADFRKDPARYIAKLEKDGITLDKAPAPASGPATRPATGAAAEPAQGREPSAKKGCACCE